MKRAFASIALLLAGCSMVSPTLTDPPADWAKYSGDYVTLKGSAGNSRTGPILRMSDASFIELTELPRMFAINEVARPIIVEGTIVPGEGVYEGRFVVKVKSLSLDKTPPPAPPVEEPAKKKSKKS